MAKQVITRDRFRIHAEASKEQMGDVLAELTRMGIEGIGYELITDVKRWGGNRRNMHGTTAKELIAEYIKDHPTFHIGALTAHVMEGGCSKGSTSQAVSMMVQEKLLTKLGGGNYQRADVKAIAPPTSEATKHYDVSNRDFIWRHIKNRTRFKIADLMVLFRAHKRQPKSISPVMTKMAADKMVKWVSNGEYLVLKKAGKQALVAKKKTKRAARKQQPAPKPANLNGAAHQTEIADHG